ncbi:MAG: undecaprenyl/decaprenyl-phosphate alpha-N-acetylglucosaminyl 1-phosphate transferase [Pirellulaceae bacterium]|nr:undecaprenyl/decaprenyl-phosphate alpha-N-acetylglucosaminyl 1-phosphate transferase [Pirellulaceae bacterium]
MQISYLLWLVVGTVVPSLLISWSATFAIRRWAFRWGLVDRPATPSDTHQHKTHQHITPLGGGIAIWAGVIVTFTVGQLLVIWIPTDANLSRYAPQLLLDHAEGLRSKAPELWFLLLAATLLMVLGLMDDLVHLGWRVRLICQCAVAATGVCLFEHWKLTVYLDLPWVTGVLSIVWIVGLINAFNMLDNMDGLSAGVAAIASVMLAATLLLVPEPGNAGPQLFVAAFLFVLAGSVMGFLWHNRPRAKIFMGDAGSYLVGFCIGVATILATFAGYANSSSHTILAPICVMAVPFYDMVSVIIIRLYRGSSPFEADRSHFSHRLVDLGFSRAGAVLTIYLTTFICGLAGLLLHQVNGQGALLVMLLVFSILVMIGILETMARQKVAARHDSSQDEDSDTSR